MFNPRFIGILKHPGYNGGDSPSSQGPTQTNVTNTNIPEYAQPYVEAMLGATQQQLFNTTKDANGNISLTGLKPYTPYSTNMNDYVAGFSPLQKQAQQGASSLRLPGQIGQGSMLAGQGGIGSLGAASQAMGTGQNYFNMAGNSAMTQSLMNPYLNASLAPQLQLLNQQFGQQNANLQGQATGAGAFGGSREALMEGLNQQNQNLAQQQAISQGYNTAFNQAQQEEQFGAGLGLQGLQAGLQGYGQAINAGQALGQLGSQQLAGQQAILGMQNQFGSQQQQLEQQKMNQGIQNYATEQQYPLMELGTMSNMLRGLPMQASTTQMYQAQPSALTQGIGAAGALGSLGRSGVMNKEGGLQKSYAKGGIASFDVGGAVYAKLAQMSLPELEQQAKVAQSPQEKDMINRLITLKSGDKSPATPVPDVVSARKGGILAFDGTQDEGSDVKEDKKPITKEDIANAKYAAWNTEVNPALETGFKALFPPSLALTDNPIRSAVKDALRYPFKGSVAGVDEKGNIQTREQKYGKTPYSDETIKNREANITQSHNYAKKLEADYANQMANERAVQAQRNNLTGSPVADDGSVSPGIDYEKLNKYPGIDPAIVKRAYENASVPTSENAAFAAIPNAKPAPAAVPGPYMPPNTQAATQNKGIGYDNVPPAVKSLLSDSRSEAQVREDNLHAVAEYSIKGANTPQAQKQLEYYQKKIDEAPDKAKQTFWLHSAAFFADMATRPGPFVVAAMGALKEQIPLYVKDKEEQEKYVDQLNKAQFDISNAELLRRQGLWKEAEEITQKHITEVSKTWNDVATRALKEKEIGVQERRVAVDEKMLPIHQYMAESGRLSATKDPAEVQQVLNVARDKGISYTEALQIVDGWKYGDKPAKDEERKDAQIANYMKTNFGDVNSGKQQRLDSLKSSQAKGKLKDTTELNRLLRERETLYKEAFNLYRKNEPYQSIFADKGEGANTELFSKADAIIGKK